MHRIERAAAVLVLAATLPVPAMAHAHLTRAEPAVGATVHTAPVAVTIDYSEAVEPKFSTIEVQDSSGGRVDAGPAGTAPGDGKRLTVPLKAIGPGSYRVVWHATSVDTHRTEGSFSFTVVP